MQDKPGSLIDVFSYRGQAYGRHRRKYHDPVSGRVPIGVQALGRKAAVIWHRAFELEFVRYKICLDPDYNDEYTFAMNRRRYAAQKAYEAVNSWLAKRRKGGEQVAVLVNEGSASKS